VSFELHVASCRALLSQHAAPSSRASRMIGGPLSYLNQCLDRPVTASLAAREVGRARAYAGDAAPANVSIDSAVNGGRA
jgi:hypothetical protein